MLFYGVDITDKFRPMPPASALVEAELDADDHEGWLNYLDHHAMLATVLWSPGNYRNPHCLEGMPLPKELVNTACAPVRHRFAWAIRQFHQDELRAACPWFDDLVAVLQGQDAKWADALVIAEDCNSGDEPGDEKDLCILVGFWPDAFPLEIGRQSLPADFLAKAKWHGWKDYEE